MIKYYFNHRSNAIITLRNR